MKICCVQMTKMRIAILLSVSILSCLESSEAQTTCSLTVMVKDVGGSAVRRAPVEVVEYQTGRVLRARSDDSGKAEFCDLSVLPVRIIVGTPQCLRVEVSAFPIDWGENSTTVTFDVHANLCQIDLPHPGGCKVAVRAQNSKGEAIPSALVTFDSAPSQPLVATQKRKTDKFGRVLVLPKFDTSIRGSVEATGFKTAEFQFLCTFTNQRFEHVVRLAETKTGDK